MDYKRFRKALTYEEYFKDWEEDKLKLITEDNQKRIYDIYKLKCELFQRDNFVCQNTDCVTPESPITWHHIKARRNNGHNKLRNSVTLCATCHEAFEHNKASISFDKDAKNLPSHIRGHTFRLHKSEKIDWKALRAEMKKIRKELKAKDYKASIDWDIVCLLMKWLYIPYNQWDDDIMDDI